MENMDKTFIDIDELAKRIDERIKELEEMNKPNVQEENAYTNENLGNDMDELNELIEAIDKRIMELEQEEETREFELNLEDLTDKVNQKLDELDFKNETESDLDKTFSDLSEISKIINDTIKKLEKQKEKKRKKAMYCDLARQKARKCKNNRKNK